MEVKIVKFCILIFGLGLAFGCSEEESFSSVRNNFIMKTVAPAVVGDTIEFAYAMATFDGYLESASAEASIAGGFGTGFASNAYSTDSRGDEVAVQVANSASEGESSSAVFSLDTNAVTLRFYYVVPEIARDQRVSFTFRVVSSTGATAAIATPKYKVSAMDIKRNLELKDNAACYFSLTTMRAYTEEQVLAQGISDKIDFRYIYDAVNSEGFPYGHALVSLGSDEKYLNNRLLPGSFTKNKVKIEKRVFVNDMQLSGKIPATFVDDEDFETIDLSEASDFILGINTGNSAFIETADGKYRGYIYINSARSRTLNFGVKRYTVE